MVKTILILFFVRRPDERLQNSSRNASAITKWTECKMDSLFHDIFLYFVLFFEILTYFSVHFPKILNRGKKGSSVTLYFCTAYFCTLDTLIILFALSVCRDAIIGVHTFGYCPQLVRCRKAIINTNFWLISPDLLLSEWRDCNC